MDRHKKRHLADLLRHPLRLAGIIVVLALAVGAATVAFANLTGSTFEGGDGNLTADGPGNKDWANIGINCTSNPPVGCALDKPTGSTDDSFGQGTKEDTEVPSVVSGSIPNNKSDLTRFYVASEKPASDIFLYLAWERVQSPQGTTNMDFEFNQVSTPSANGVTPVRTAGDLLIKYDLSKGGTTTANLHIGFHRWVTQASALADPNIPDTPAGACEASNTFPCWGKVQDLIAGQFEGASNGAVTQDPIPPNNPRNLDILTFGEVSINLSATGIFSPTVCQHFGSAYLKSRSSDSFTAELKDFIAPIPVNISNCGTLIVKKITDPSPDPTDTTFSFSVNGPNPPNTILPKSVSLKNGQSDSPGTVVFAGTAYSVAETVPTNWALQSATCDNGSGTLSGSTISNISVAADETVTCTFTNKLQLGAIKVTKQSVKGNAPLAGATFAIKSGSTTVATLTTGSDGTACTGNLAFGSYTVTETGAPTGYAIDNTSPVSVSVDHNASCSSGTPNAPASAFTDTPLSSIQVKFTSLAGAGVTNASIVCTSGGSTVNPVSENGAADPAFDDTDETITNLSPGTYVCTVVVDP